MLYYSEKRAGCRVNGILKLKGIQWREGENDKSYVLQLDRVYCIIIIC
jgi:hypothetical protein